MLPDAIEKRYQWRISDVCYRRWDGPRLHSCSDHNVFGGNGRRLPSRSRAAATPHRWHPVPPAQQPHVVPCCLRRSPAPSPHRLRSNPASCRRPWSCPVTPCEDATGERERIEEKGYGRERRGCRMKIRKKEEKG
jgi:hypothetical protein